MNSQQFVIFTDLDGTLLDHHTYSHAAAVPMLKKLFDARIPVIPNTSKTYEELKVLREQLDLKGPFIVENGAAIHIPHGFFKQKPSQTQWSNGFWVRQFTSRKQYWLSLLDQVKEAYQGEFTHFAEMSIEDICASTGLTKEDALRASKRQYGEPVMWLGSEQRKQQFITDVSSKGAKPLQGGRFIHISGECDKGAAMLWMMQEFHRQYPKLSCKSIALGDGGNDVAMLNAADYAVRIKSPSHDFPELQKQHQVVTTTQEGPSGWTEALNEILHDYI